MMAIIEQEHTSTCAVDDDDDDGDDVSSIHLQYANKYRVASHYNACSLFSRSSVLGAHPLQQLFAEKRKNNLSMYYMLIVYNTFFFSKF